MKRQFSLIASLALGLVMVAPAFADGWYEHHDSDHDGRWNYSEFRDAHNNWYNEHHEGRMYKDRELEHQFKHFDRDHDGFVHREEVENFHRW